jgi:hypothetical protein
MTNELPDISESFAYLAFGAFLAPLAGAAFSVDPDSALAFAGFAAFSAPAAF